jgi:flagellar hook protein FlgE
MTQRVNVDGDGNLVATLGSGETVNLAQLSIASFNNPKGLTKIGGNLYAANQATGVANLGTAGTNGRGAVVGGSLEQSNVDMALEFTRMILAQRGYQASSRTITASDEMLLETLNLKR